jgi:hypothetical protein
VRGLEHGGQNQKESALHLPGEYHRRTNPRQVCRVVYRPLRYTRRSNRYNTPMSPP